MRFRAQFARVDLEERSCLSIENTLDDEHIGKGIQADDGGMVCAGSTSFFCTCVVSSSSHIFYFTPFPDLPKSSFAPFFARERCRHWVIFIPSDYPKTPRNSVVPLGLSERRVGACMHSLVCVEYRETNQQRQLAHSYTRLPSPKYVQRQLDASQRGDGEKVSFDPGEWSRNACFLADYYSGLGRFLEAGRCLLAAQVCVFSRSTNRD